MLSVVGRIPSAGSALWPGLLRGLCSGTTPASSSSDFGSLDVSSHKLQRPARAPPRKRAPKTVLPADPARTSLVAETLAEMDSDEDFKLTAAALKQFGQKRLTLEERKVRRRALDDLGVPPFADFLAARGLAIERAAPTVLQLNIGLYCNQACSHCHVESSPKRTEMMSREVAAQAVAVVLATPSIDTVDITGGAPELCDQFEYLVRELRARARADLTIIDRCNLTVLCEPGQEDLAAFLAEQRVHVVASLPCYSAKNVNQQRGKGVFGRSIDGLLALNEAGFGNDPLLQLDLVYNPLGAFLPPPQAKLEEQYKAELAEHFGVVFNSLFAFSNMPIKRFADFLHRRGELADYMELLVRNFNSETLPALMCTNTISVGWTGEIYDCDFNQQLEMGIEKGSPGVGAHVGEGASAGGCSSRDNPFAPRHRTIFDLADGRDLLGVPIAVENHCFGCTAGAGSS